MCLSSWYIVFFTVVAVGKVSLVWSVFDLDEGGLTRGRKRIVQSANPLCLQQGRMNFSSISAVTQSIAEGGVPPDDNRQVEALGNGVQGVPFLVGVHDR